MLKPVVVLFLLMYVALPGNAQNSAPKTDTLAYYFRAGNELVSTADSAEYIRMIYSDANEPGIFIIKEIYKNGKPKLSAKALTNKLKPDFEGDYIEFYSNGKRKTQMTFNKGVLTGKCYSFFPNGRLYTVINNYTDAFKKPLQKLEECYDVDGKQLCLKGEGEWIEYSPDRKTIDIYGKVKNGHKYGEWQGYMPDSSRYVETYSGGMMKTWDIFDKQGNKTQYSSKPLADSLMYKPAGYPGGSAAMSNFLAHQIRFPRVAMQNRTNGTVLVNFTISASGELSHFRIVKGIQNMCNEEAIRIIKLSSPWVPAYKNGQAVTSTFTMGVAFNIYGVR